MQTDERIGKVSIVGAGMRSHPGVAAKVFEVLGGEGINIEMISTSPIKISCVISADRVPDAVKALHEAFELGPDAVRRRGQKHRRADGLMTRYRVGVLGATGLVGTTILEVLAERGFPAAEVVPFASERSVGKQIEWNGTALQCRALSEETIQGLDVVLSSAGGAVSAEWAPKFVEAGRRGRRQHQLLADARRRAPRRRRGQPGRRSTATAGSSPTRTARPCRWSSR